MYVCTYVCVYCLLQAQSRWCKMKVSHRAIHMRNPVLALLSLSVIIMLVYVWCLIGVSPKVVLKELIVWKAVLLYRRGPKAAKDIMPDAQRHTALYQMPTESKGPGTITVPFLAAAPLSAQLAKLRSMRLQDPRILLPVTPPGVLQGFACTPRRVFVRT